MDPPFRELAGEEGQEQERRSPNGLLGTWRAGGRSWTMRMDSESVSGGNTSSHPADTKADFVGCHGNTASETHFKDFYQMTDGPRVVWGGGD